MECPSCGIEVREHQKFCAECGTPLHPVTAVDTDLDTQQLDAQPADADEDAGIDTEPIEAPPTDVSGDDTNVDTEPVDTVTAPAVADTDLDTEPVEQLPPPAAEESTGETPAAPLIVPADESPTSFGAPTSEMVVPAAATTSEFETREAVSTTEEMPAIFDGQDDLVEYPTPREPFRLRLIFLFSLFTAGAVVMAIVADVIDIRTSRPTSGIVTGTSTLDDLGSNLGLAGFVGVAVMVIGALLACFGLRWGAGLAGGAGLALVGWAGLVIGLAELPIGIAESVTRTSSESFTLRVTRDLGWWLIAGVGIVALIVFLASLRSIGSGGRPALNPLVAALTAVAVVVLAAGPLVPVGNAAFADNFRSVDPDRDLPTAFFAGRLGQVALIALTGVIGMLIVRSFGLGLAAGGVSVAAWLWLSSLIELGDNPVGIAYRNPGATDTVPHAVTTTGTVATLVLLVVAGALATYRLTRSPAP